MTMQTKIRTIKQNHSNKRTTSVYAKDDAFAEDKNNRKFMRARSGGETDKKEKGVNYWIQPNHNSNRVNKENKMSNL